MSVTTYKKYSSYGDVVGEMDAAEKAIADAKIDFLDKAFKSFDKDNSGFIDPQELKAALTMLGVKAADGVADLDGDGRLSLDDLDTDHDDKVSFEEFKVLAAVLPKREHAIYKGALSQKPRDRSASRPGQASAGAEGTR